MRARPIFEKKILNERGFNPVYGFFHTHPNPGLALARFAMAFYLLFHGLQHVFGLMESMDTVHLFDYFSKKLDEQNLWMLTLISWFEIVGAFFLLAGFLTRLVSLAAFSGMVWMLYTVWNVLTPLETELYVLVSVLFLVLLLGGGGKASLDGGISEQLLP